MTRLRASRLVVLWGLFAWGCAARGPSPQLLADLSRADALLRDGCYRCLEEALAIYERASSARRAPASALNGAFEAALLIAVREKELGVPSHRSMERARTLAQSSTLVDAAASVAGELSGLDPDERQRRSQEARKKAAASDPVPTDTLAGAYVALALACERAQRPSEIQAGEIVAKYGTLPLFRYRAAICGLPGSPLTGLYDADRRWVEILFFEGAYEMRSRAGDPARAAELLTAARDAFPRSHAIVLVLGRAQQALGEYDAALASVDSVLADVPTHRDALLGRVENLSYLNRSEEAVAAASRMIELGTWYLGDAYYWRAWNEQHLNQLDIAWADVEQALKLRSNTSVYTLAGFIAHGRKDLDVAIDRFTNAFSLDPGNCIAVFSAGMVHVEQQAWVPASEKFARAMTCYTADAAAARAALARIEGLTYSPARKARMAAVEEKRVASSEQLSAQSAFNAAQCYVRLGQKSSALTYVDAAVAHPLMRDKAASLKVVIEKMR